MGRSPCCSKVGLRRGPWSTKEDTLLSDYILQHGEGQWRSLPKNAGLLRCGKSCRLRWMNYLRPGIKRGNINQDEEDLIVRMHGLLGNRWSLIAGRLPGRTDNEIKNYWNTHLLKKLHTAGIHPKSHKELPKKPAKTKETGPGNKEKQQKKKKKKKKKKEDAAPPTEAKPENDGEQSKTEFKVYMPKPIRVSSVFSRTDSYDSLTSGASSSVADKVDWPSLLDLEEGGYGYGYGGDEDDFLGAGCILPLLLDSISRDADMLDQVYDEYLQLL